MIGKTLAHYEVLAHLGAGGMGEVFRARDTKLGREVALKILPAAVAEDPERLARFQREAQLLASLNHPNIAAIHGVEVADGVRFLVMELAEGQDLQMRLREGAFPLEDATSIARAIAEGLEEAHERGVVHRDLKPANVMVSDAGKVKILDFGLARAYSGGDHEEGDPALSPTITAAMTSAGTVLGSAAYMSPEQAKGREVDRRTDIWAFGVILYEMITGKRLFDGETISETMAAVLKDPIDLDALPTETPASIRSVLARCLERDPMQRLRDIGEARIHLDPSAATRVLSGSAHQAVVEGPGTRKTSWLPWALFAAATVAAIGLGLRPSTPPSDDAPDVRRFAIETPDGTSFHLSGANPGPLTLSPDGSRAVFTARDETGTQSLWFRDLALATAQRVPGTEGAQYAFWSPDGTSVAYYSGADLRILDLESRTNRAIIGTTSGKGGAWLADGTILFTRTSVTSIERIDPDTGEATVLTDLEAEPVSNSHRHPRDLGNGRNFLFAARTVERSNEAPVAILLGDLEGGPAREILRADGQAEFANGHILYGQNGKLYARPFDVDALEFTGPPTLIAEGVGLIPGAALTLLSVSRNGALVFHPGERTTLLANLSWFGMDGEALGHMGDPAGFGTFAISPDGERVAFAAFDNRLGTGDLFIQELESGVRTRLTFDGIDESYPVWSPDGRLIYYLAAGPSTNEVRVLEPDGREDPKVVFVDSTMVAIHDVSPDGRFLSYSTEDSGIEDGHAYLRPLDGSSGPILIDDVSVSSRNATFSPDGKWIAYAIVDAGGWNLYVKTNPPGTRKWEVSQTSAFWYDWHPDGSMILHQWDSADVDGTPVDLTGTTPSFGTTRVVIENVQAPLSALHRFEIAPDGQRILISTGDNMDDSRPARVVLNWPELVRREME